MLRKLFYILLIIFIIILCIWYLIIKPKAQTILFTELTRIAPTLMQEQLHVSPTGFKINSAFNITTNGLPLNLSNPSLKLDLLSLISLKPAINIATGLLDGELVANVSATSSFKQFESKINFKNIRLYQQPTIRLIGFSQGILNAEILISQINTLPGTIPDFKFNMQIEDLNITSANKLPAFISKYPIKIPAFSAGNLSLKGNCSGNSCRTEILEFSSSLGEIKGQAEINQLTQKPQYTLTLDFALTKSGKEQLLPYLALANQRVLDNPDRLFALKLQGSSNSSNVSVVAK